MSFEKKAKNKFGQYFTPKDIAEFMCDLADISKQTSILEPSCGEGVFLDVLIEKGHKNLTAYEVDSTLNNTFDFVQYQSFVSTVIDNRFDVIIGNPPYIRWRNIDEKLKDELAVNELWQKHCNALCDYLSIFILKSIELLNENGQLIFICPEYWFNTTHSQSLRDFVVTHGYFEQIFHFEETPIFDNVKTSTIIFKYIKSSCKKDTQVIKFHSKQKLTKNILTKIKNYETLDNTQYFSIPTFQTQQKWILQPRNITKKISHIERLCQKYYSQLDLLAEQLEKKYSTIGDICDIGNGMVSGLDKAFQIDPNKKFTLHEKKSMIDVAKAKHLSPFFINDTIKYIFMNNDNNILEKEFKELYPNFYEQLKPYQNRLEKRYAYNRDIKYWQWSFLRNFSLFNSDKPKIFVPSKDRISQRSYFRFSLVKDKIFPTQDVTAILKKDKTLESIEYILFYLNTPMVFDWLKYSGVVKGGVVEFSEKPIASIPFRAINWSKPEEKIWHDEITQYIKSYLCTKNKKMLGLAHHCFEKLLEIS